MDKGKLHQGNPVEGHNQVKNGRLFGWNKGIHVLNFILTKCNDRFLMKIRLVRSYMFP